MDALRGAAPLARLLLALSEAGREGELSFVQRSHSVRLSIARGRVTALTGVDVRPLGDTLLTLGALDVVSQRGLLSQQGSERVGARLVAAGATSSRAVLRALELQLVEGVESLLRWPVSELVLSPAPTPRAHGVVTLDLVSLVWTSLLRLADTLPEATLRQLAGHEALALTVGGERRVRSLLHAAESGALAASELRRALLGNAEQAPRQPHGRGQASVEVSAKALALALAVSPEPAALPLRAVLRVLGSASARPSAEDAYALLLRKTRELARNASASVLLDLPASADAQHARRALRRLAKKLHPDRFQAGDARLHAVSHRVMGALALAEHTLRTPASA